MAVLIVQNGYSSKLTGLGKIKPIYELSEKRISTAVRNNLRLEYGKINVKVPCNPSLLKGTWNGKCTIKGVEYNYEIKP